ncbi:MarR family transcriptional regulator [Xylanibacillus composti]|uniref:Putative HTH-type transcriptional regulator YxaD n=1 Tax=Xylanibacillus composti TaxID=1572762 RepID=A0A8J4H1H1_9BACL|nr:MarR family transcriptional regulator [Xylanibacillus composti]MDT9725385.1 MarR family transcriptional regulator [Xylanibacillus composti]GIQ69149.1 putative HTH-type transcriptional regulator YxaD [Xylanibacillus composti]
MHEQSMERIEQELTDFIRRIVATETRTGSLDRSAYILLRQLSLHGPAGVKTLADELRLDVSTVSRQAAALVDKQYVEKVPNPLDGRSYFYRLSARGEKEFEENRRLRQAKLMEVFQDWTEEERESFGQLLQKYNQSVNRMLHNL